MLLKIWNLIIIIIIKPQFLIKIKNAKVNKKMPWEDEKNNNDNKMQIAAREEVETNPLFFEIHPDCISVDDDTSYVS